MAKSIPPSGKMKSRIRWIMSFVFFIIFSMVVKNFFHISIIENEKYQKMANDQHFGSISISAHRGSIYDAKGNTLAKSASVYKVFLDPTRFREDMKIFSEQINRRNADIAAGKYVPKLDEAGNITDALPSSIESFKAEMVALIAVKLGISEGKVLTAMEENTQYSVLQDQVEKPVADELLDYFSNYGFISLNVEEDTKRYYPQNELAASVIGFTLGDGSGVYGVEASYDEYLSGHDGKTISAKDSNGNELPYRYSKTYAPKDGGDVYLTVDMNIQYALEKHLKEMNEQFGVKNRSCAILMNAKTGAVYGMATYPTFDLNQPYEIADESIKASIDALAEDEKDKVTGEERIRQWKNKCVTETYEPGSVFKVITSASAIEENLINLTKDSFYCSGSVTLDGAFHPINCHNTAGHGVQTFQQALTNSCNPAFMEIGARLGYEKFCYYFDAFGFREPTGIDLPAESGGLGRTLEEMSNVDLAVSSFGQSETVTPLEMITAYCATINGGYLLQPYVVDKIIDKDGNIVLNNERTVRRQVISEETSATMRQALKNVVTDNGGGNVSIKGYSIGGKSGTSQRLSETAKKTNNDASKEEDADEQEYGASYVCFTPAEDPEIILLVLADMPDKNIAYYGSKVAVPTARDILTDVLPYLGINPEYTQEELENLDVKVPLLEGSIDSAKATLEGLGMQYEVIGSGIEVVAQSPITGTSVAKGGTVYLYTEAGNTAEYTEVPDLQYLSPSMANDVIANYELNYVTRGASVKREDATVKSQSIAAGTKVPKGTCIEIELEVNESSD